MTDKKNATVEYIAGMMLDLMAEGKADYVVTCNDEYVLAMEGDEPTVKDDKEVVDIGGYC